jgi:hypothetical protein
MSEMESEKCGPGCDCGKPSGNKKVKAAVCLVVLLAVCGILVYKAKTATQASPVNTGAAFAAPLVNAVNEQKPTVEAVDASDKVGESLDSLAALDKLAIDQDAVFVFIPASGPQIISKQTTDAIASAVQRIESSGAKLGLYTLQPGSPEYTNIAAQLSVPGMLVMSKGCGTGAVSGEITETKILQAYIASSRAGGCGPSGCGPAGCN